METHQNIRSQLLSPGVNRQGRQIREMLLKNFLPMPETSAASRKRQTKKERSVRSKFTLLIIYLGQQRKELH